MDGIPPGRYAIQAYHDEDGNGRVRRGLFGIPAEVIGFSRHAPVRLGAHRFEDAAIRSQSRPQPHACGCVMSGRDLRPPPWPTAALKEALSGW